MSYVEMHQTIRVRKATLAQYPANTIWVEVWHLASHSQDGNFTVTIRQSNKYFKDHGRIKGIKNVAWKSRLRREEMIEFCQEISEKFGLPFELFELHGSSLGDSSWLREKLAKEA